MAAPVAPAAPARPRPGPRAAIPERTLRTDRWWVSPRISFVVLLAFVVYATWAAFVNAQLLLQALHLAVLLAVPGHHVRATVPGAPGYPT